MSLFVCFFFRSHSRMNLKKYCKEKMPFIVLTASHTESLLKRFFFFFLKKTITLSLEKVACER